MDNDTWISRYAVSWAGYFVALLGALVAWVGVLVVLNLISTEITAGTKGIILAVLYISELAYLDVRRDA